MDGVGVHPFQNLGKTISHPSEIWPLLTEFLWPSDLLLCVQMRSVIFCSYEFGPFFFYLCPVADLWGPFANLHSTNICGWHFRCRSISVSCPLISSLPLSATKPLPTSSWKMSLRRCRYDFPRGPSYSSRDSSSLPTPSPLPQPWQHIILTVRRCSRRDEPQPFTKPLCRSQELEEGWGGGVREQLPGSRVAEEKQI
jgi:hypothetical protein